MANRKSYFTNAVTEGPRKPNTEAEVHREVAKSEVPDGLSVAATLDWVSDDKARAEAALAVEKTSDSPRQTLLHSLERIVNEDTGAGIASGEA